MSTLHVNLIGRFGEPPFEIHRTAGLFKVSGIYAIINRVDGKRYIGSAACLKTRISYHRSMLRNDRHDNSHLQRAWNRYGENNFSFFIIQFCAIADLIEKEAWWMWLTCACDRRLGYNLDRIATHKLHCEETKRKISAAHIGKKATPEARAKMSAFQKGRKHLIPKSAEMRAKYSKALMGHFVSEETKRKIGNIHRGKTLSEEQKRMISLCHKGKTVSEETKV